MSFRHIFVSGGFENGNATTDVTRYAIDSDTWLAMPSMNVARLDHSSCCVKDTVYVFGGKINHTKITDTIEKLENAGSVNDS